jgi:hypothetical protein
MNIVDRILKVGVPILNERLQLDHICYREPHCDPNEVVKYRALDKHIISKIKDPQDLSKP